MSWKCFILCYCNCRHSMIRTVHCLCLTGRLVLSFFTASCLVILYNSLELLCLAAISTSFATFFDICFLFPLCFLTVVFLSWYCCRSFSFLVICFLVQFHFSLPPCLSSFPCVVCNPVLPSSFLAALDLFTDVCACILPTFQQ